MDENNGGPELLEIVSWKEARESGLKFYYTGKPCVRGHLSKRFAQSGVCLECQKEKNKKRYQENAESIKKVNSAYRKANIERYRQAVRNWKIKNPQYNKEWKNKNRAKFSTYRKWWKSNKSHAVASWDKEFTRFVSFEAFELVGMRQRSTGIAWEIDRMIPIKAKLVCGLHTWSNLQVIPAILNKRKGNRLELTEPGEWIKKM